MPVNDRYFDSFEVLVVSPGYLEHAGLAIAGSKAGAAGILDIEFCQPGHLEQVKKNLHSMLNLANPDSSLGLRLSCRQLACPEIQEGLDLLIKDLREHLAAKQNLRTFWFVLSSFEQTQFDNLQEKLLKIPKGKILVELKGADELDKVADNNFEGIILKGNESGGFAGPDAAFVFAQKGLNRIQDISLYIKGGAGPHTAAACYLAGAKGVVLDDQLLFMPESPLPAAWKRELENLSGQETVLLGAGLGLACRVLNLPRFEGARKLSAFEKQIEGQKSADQDPGRQWEEGLLEYMGWGDPKQRAWPVGQGIMHAAYFAEHYMSTGRLIQAIKKEAVQQARAAGAADPLQPGSALAKAHKTKYPLVQGPMAQVSDNPDFLAAVADSGALPFLGLGTMSWDNARECLTRTRDKLGEKTWGVGLLGFLPAKLYKQQIEEVLKVKPLVALLAGGRPDQVKALEKEGISTYLHVPVPGLIKPFLKQGIKKLVFEGRESGGHVGPLGSLPLWEASITRLKEEIQGLSAEDKKDIQVLFAGGIHDRLSGAMVAAAAEPLSRQGVKIGLQMGTAYLFSQEAVQTKAITSGYQEEAIACKQTITLEMGSGHANRCTLSPFADQFYVLRKGLLAEHKSGAELTESLQKACQGRLRIAAKGIVKDSQGLYVNIDQEEQKREGMYLIGEAAALQNNVFSLKQLNAEVSQAGSELLQELQADNIDCSPDLAAESKPSNIAITGIAFFLPGASDLDTYWQNILQKKEVVTEVPQDYWDLRLVYDPDKTKQDKSYSKWGGFIEEVVFDPITFGIPPKYVGHISPIQLIALETAKRALQDAGYLQADFDRENTAVIFSNSDYGGYLGHQLMMRSYLPFLADQPYTDIADRVAEWNEESLPGILPNILAGRVANRFNLGGPNYVLDAACASSITALDHGVRELESGRTNIALVGCAEFGQNPFAYTGFSRIQALSAKGRAKVFDKSAEGIVLSEGCVVFLLKRLEDAEKDGDKIHAVIKSVGASSDGRGMAMTAPLPAGQIRALKRAYAKAAFPFSTVGFYEAHGTATPVGDRAETETVVNLLKEQNAAFKSLCLGAGKSLMGHTKIAAGLAALVKCILALSYKVLPPQGNLDNPLDPIADPQSPVAMYKEAVPWLSPIEHPRRSTASSFGFGGSNAHAVLEEYAAGYNQYPPGGQDWPWELLLFKGKDLEEVRQKIAHLFASLEKGAEPKLRDLAYSCARDFEQNKAGGHFLALLVQDTTHLKSLIRHFFLHCDDPEGVTLPAEIISRPMDSARERPKIAFLFPGQGSQYPHMAREDCLYFSEMREILEKAESIFKDTYTQPLHQYLFPPGPFSEKERKRQHKELQDSHVLQPVLVALSAGYTNLAGRLGLKPDMVCGHSLGEYSALYAGGVISAEQLLRLTETRGRLMSRACRDVGTMAAVKASRERVEAILDEFQEVVLANHNAPEQVVISGQDSPVQDMVNRLKQDGVYCTLLPVAGAFHSTMMKKVQEPLAQAIEAEDFKTPQIPVYSNITAQPYADDAQVIKEQLQGHLTNKVEFVRQVLNMYEQGARIFIEMGPGKVLSNLVGQILKDREYTSLALDQGGEGLKDTLAVWANLASSGVSLETLNLYEGRDVKYHNLQNLVQESKPLEIPGTAWILNGCNSRPKDVSVRNWGKKPPLDLESALANKESAEQEHKDQIQDKGTTPMQQKTGFDSRESEVLQAYKQYQETMRNFLALQEKVVQTFMQGQTPDMQLPLDSPDPGPQLGAATGPETRPGTSRALEPEEDSKTARDAFSGLRDKKVEQESSPETGAQAEQGTASEAEVETEKAAAMDALTRLQQMISEQTGYPVDMLGSDMDLESELGIDSIKRIEILEAFLDNLPQTEAEQLRARMNDLSRVRTLKALADMLEIKGQGLVSEGLSTVQKDQNEDHNKDQQEVQSKNVFSDQVALLDKLQEMISERTGYPADMLGPAMDLESELGIDSIKRIEILESLTEVLPEQEAALLRENMDELSRAKTLNALVDCLIDQEEPVEQTEQAEDQSTPGPKTPAQESIKSEKTAKQWPVQAEQPEQKTCPRYLMQAFPAPLPKFDWAGFNGLFLITEDSLSVAALVAQKLNKCGAQAEIISQQDLLSLEKIKSRVLQARNEHGHVRGIIHLAALADLQLPQNIEDWKAYTQVQIKSLFQLLQVCANDLQEDDSRMGRVLAASYLGGYFGRYNRPGQGLPLGGGCQGLLKTLYLEWPRVYPKAIDIGSNLTAEHTASIITREAALPLGEVEVGYPEGERTVFKVVNAPLVLQKEKPENAQDAKDQDIREADWVVLVTGGARGVTSLATKSFIKPGMRVVIAGRSTLEPEKLAEVSALNTAAELRKYFLEQNKKHKLSKTPAQIEAEVKNILKKREIRENLEAMQDAGAQVEYKALDVRDEQALGKLIEDIYAEYRRLDAVIHGAGFIADKLISEKDMQSLDRVFDTKADSTFILARYLRPEQLKLIVFFSSTAGRFGNQGQADYAAANEVLNRFACWMGNNWSQVKAVAINWGPWNYSGMATSELNKRFKDLGIIPIDPDAGADFFVQEIRVKDKSICEVIAGEGPWNSGVQEGFDPFFEFNMFSG